MEFPVDNWQEALPESQGVDSVQLQRAMSYLARKSGRDGTKEAVLARNGIVVWKGENVIHCHDVWSCTKSFTSTVLGLLIDEGKCSLDTRAHNYVASLVADYSSVNLRHFATMTSGYDGGGHQSPTPFRPTRPLFSPGERFQYWDSAMNQFANVLTHIANEPIMAVFKRRIADPIGLNPVKWGWGDFGLIEGVKVHGGAGNKGKGIFISALEMTRFGHLFLNQGNWRGKQLISSSWVCSATSSQVPPHLPTGAKDRSGAGEYGFNWWTNELNSQGKRRWREAPPFTYAAVGFNNNKCFVIPEWNMVFVRLGTDGNVSDRVYSRFFKKLRKALNGSG